MTNLPPPVKAGCATVGVLVVVLVVVIGILVGTRRPPPTIPELLASLEPAERAALERLCADAQIAPTQLRPLAMWQWQLQTTPLAISADDRKHVRALRISGTALADMRAVAPLTGLHILWLDGNRLTKLDGLSALPLLREVNVRGNAIDAITGPLPPALNVLDIGENRLPGFDGVAWPKYCQQLFAAHNAVTSLDFLAQAPSLFEVDLDHNQVGTLDPLLPLASSSLVKLYLRHNQVSRLPEGRPVQKDLKVWLEGNPLTGAPEPWPAD